MAPANGEPFAAGIRGYYWGYTAGAPNFQPEELVMGTGRARLSGGRQGIRHDPHFQITLGDDDHGQRYAHEE